MLTDARCRAAKATGKPYKLADAAGLHLHVSKTGHRSWRHKFRYGGKEQLRTLGSFPERVHLAAGHDPALAETGIRFVAMDHTGCGQRSAEEVARVKELAEGLIGTPFTDRNGESATLRWKNILIVAPYNMQVNALAAALPSAARVGTVDKFQGQEAEVVIVSLATSTPDDLPRHVEFFYSKNRKHGVSQADVYQMMAYARLYSCRELMLLYPSTPGASDGPRQAFGIHGGRERLRIATVDVAKDKAVIESALVDLALAMLAGDQLAPVATSARAATA
jgi:hypothetical protein